MKIAIISMVLAYFYLSETLPSNHEERKLTSTVAATKEASVAQVQLAPQVGCELVNHRKDCGFDNWESGKSTGIVHRRGPSLAERHKLGLAMKDFPIGDEEDDRNDYDTIALIPLGEVARGEERKEKEEEEEENGHGLSNNFAQRGRIGVNKKFGNGDDELQNGSLLYSHRDIEDENRSPHLASDGEEEEEPQRFNSWACCLCQRGVRYQRLGPQQPFERLRCMWRIPVCSRCISSVHIHAIISFFPSRLFCIYTCKLLIR